MGSRPVAALTADGRKLHLQHGPIDLIVTGDGPNAARRRAFASAEVALGPVLEELVEELPLLRAPTGSSGPVSGPVARRMVAATSIFGDHFVTPMAAVAGAVAQHVLERSMDDQLKRLTVNNGGDIAFDLRRGASTTIGVVVSPIGARLAGTITIHESSSVRGLATSGWRGRSHSLGIADAVTVLAHDAAIADAAATVIASAVDLPGHPKVERVPAGEIDANSDLGRRLVTVSVGELSDRDCREALEPGSALARDLMARGFILGAYLVVGGASEALHVDVSSPFTFERALERRAGQPALAPVLTPAGS